MEPTYKDKLKAIQTELEALQKEVKLKGETPELVKRFEEINMRLMDSFDMSAINKIFR